MLLVKYPDVIVYTGTLLGWGEVQGAHGYRVQIYDVEENRVYDSGVSSLLKDTYVEVPDVLETGYHYWWGVDAHAVDDTG
jgi:hypothetical protein